MHESTALTRRGFLSAAASAAVASGAAKRPNVLLILADDVGWRDIGFQGGEIPTPHIDRIAQEGVRLTQYSCYPLCTPTRAGLMTGRSPARYGLIYSVIRPWSTYGLPATELLLSESFHKAGYQTAIIGKWHLGHGHKSQLPNSRGFDHFYGHLNAEIDYYAHTEMGGLDWQRNGKGVREKGYTTDLLGDEALRWLGSRDRSRPFFLYLPFNAIHSPQSAPDELLRKYAHIANPKRRMMAAVLNAMDNQVGRLLELIDKEDIARDTIVLFLSDNGGAAGQGSSNQPLRGGKLTAYEGGLRVPFALRWPGKIAAGGACDQWMTVLDVFPTLAAAAEVPIEGGQPLDGQNMWSAIRGGDRIEPAEFFVACKKNETQDLQFGLRSGPWKLVQMVDPEQKTISELYRLDEDPGEKNNLAAREPMILQRLGAALDRWKRLHPKTDVQSSMNPHPGWVAPSDYAEMAADYATSK